MSVDGVSGVPPSNVPGRWHNWALCRLPITANANAAPASYDVANQQADGGASCAAAVATGFLWMPS